MAKLAQVEGLQACVKALRAHRKAKAKGLVRGLARAGLQLLRYTDPLVPVDEGILKASGYTRAEGTPLNPAQVVGFTAAHAIYVHENLEAAHGQAYNEKHADKIKAKLKGWHKRGKLQQAKFLEQPFREHAGDLRAIIKAEVDKADDIGLGGDSA